MSINDGDLVPILSTEKSSPDLNLQESENQKGAAGGKAMKSSPLIGPKSAYPLKSLANL